MMYDLNTLRQIRNSLDFGIRESDRKCILECIYKYDSEYVSDGILTIACNINDIDFNKLKKVCESLSLAYHIFKSNENDYEVLLNVYDSSMQDLFKLIYVDNLGSDDIQDLYAQLCNYKDISTYFYNDQAKLHERFYRDCAHLSDDEEITLDNINKDAFRNTVFKFNIQSQLLLSELLHDPDCWITDFEY